MIDRSLRLDSGHNGRQIPTISRSSSFSLSTGRELLAARGSYLEAERSCWTAPSAGGGGGGYVCVCVCVCVCVAVNVCMCVC